MSRSRRKTPIIGNSRAKSDKWFKQKANRELRSKMRDVLASKDPDTIDEEGNIKLKEVSNIWKSNKEGKQYYSEEEYHRLDWYREMYNLPHNEDYDKNMRK